MKKKIKPEGIANIIEILGKMKDLKRSGWIRRNVEAPESDADHSYGVALLVLILAPKHLDTYRCLELALIHDLAEIYSKDFLPGEISLKEKHHLETEAMLRICKELRQNRFYKLFQEFEAQKTAEAQFVRSLDKLETALSAVYYQQNKRVADNTDIITEFTQHAQSELQKISSQEALLALEILSSIIKK